MWYDGAVAEAKIGKDSVDDGGEDDNCEEDDGRDEEGEVGVQVHDGVLKRSVWRPSKMAETVDPGQDRAT